MAALPFFLLTMLPIPWLLLLMPSTQAAQPAGYLGYPTAAAPTRWTNSPSLEHAVDFIDGSAVRTLLLNNLYGPSFAAGFYCTSPCNAFLFAVYIVNADSGGNVVLPMVGMAQVVWAANRDRPVRENSTLSLTTAGLALRDGDGSLVWSSDVSGKAVAGLEITKSGNLVLLDDRNASVWQSFDHPTDALVPGQILAQGMMLTPNISSTNFTANDQLHITIRDAQLYAFAGSSPPQVYYSEFVNGSLVFPVNSSSVNPNEPYITLAPSRSLQYIRFESDGHLRLYEWQDWQNGWAIVQDILKLDACGYPTVCGKYGLCSNGQCSCPSDRSASKTYFRPVDNQRINLGCMPVTPISCESVQDHRLVAFSNVSYFNYMDYMDSRVVQPQLVDEESCKQACLQNCSCKAALFQHTGNSSHGSCFLPLELFSLEVLQQDTMHFNSSAYIKVQITHSPPSTPAPIRPLPNSPGRAQRSSTRIMIGVTLGSVGGLIILFIILLVCKRRKRYGEIDEEGDFGELPGMPARFTFEQLKVATEQFREKLGHGGFGSVYMGQLHEERVAVKYLDRAGQGKKEFLAEVQTTGSIHHINLVRLVGFCADKSQRLLVYEYMSKGSLDRWIYYRHDNAPLGWNIRCRIITDIAKGLCYLHEECRQKIAHLDVKPQNILLDDNFNAKLSDFGLAKLIDRDNSQVITKMRGTPGYLAPEWLTSQITEKADIYSFGVVVMEVVSGRKNLDTSQHEESIHLISLLQEKARTDQLVDLIDKNSEDMQSHNQEVVGMMKLAMWCLQIDCNKRPLMSTVVKVLEGTVEVETNIDYIFVATIPVNHANHEEIGSSAPPTASQLSGPR